MASDSLPKWTPSPALGYLGPGVFHAPNASQMLVSEKETFLLGSVSKGAFPDIPEQAIIIVVAG